LTPAAICLPLAGGAAALTVAVSARTPYRTAAAWFGLALFGQAAALQLVDAGPNLHYQHYRPLGEMASRHPWLLAVLGLQALLVAAGLVRYARARARTGRPSVRVAAALLLSIATAATVSPSVARYLAELAFAASVQLVSIATLFLMVMALPDAALRELSARLDRLIGRHEDGRAEPALPPDRFGWVAAAVTLVLAATLNVVSYHRYPHVPDEVVYLHHARYFAAGQLTMPLPPVQAAFDVDLFSYEPSRWFSPVPPGWPTVLAVGVLAGVPSLVNPTLAALCVLLTYALLRRLYSRRVARYATGLLAVSPWFVFLAMSYMTHMSTLASALVAAVGVLKARESGSFAWGAVAGAGVGAASLVRPLDGLIVGALIAAWAVGLGGARLSMRALTGLAAATVLVGALALPYNWLLTGDPMTFPINAYTDRVYGPGSNAYGFGSNRGLGWPIDPNPGHGPVDGVINANLNMFGLNTDLFGWSTGSLVFIAWLLCAARPGRSDRLMIAASVVVVGAYFFYYFSGGPDFAARYWFPMVVPLAALTARGIETLEQKAGIRAPVAACALTAMALVTFMPWRALDKYPNFRGMRADVRALAAEHGFGRDLVLVRGERAPDYAAAFVENPIDLTSDQTIYAWDRNADVRAATLRAYPDRRVWLIDGPSITGAGFRVVAGPMPAAALFTAAEAGR
jgi:4-amino-4-deoxy-L-arabinose transferase-like glycosyltransferase